MSSHGDALVLQAANGEAVLLEAVLSLYRECAGAGDLGAACQALGQAAGGLTVFIRERWAEPDPHEMTFGLARPDDLGDVDAVLAEPRLSASAGAGVLANGGPRLVRQRQRVFGMVAGAHRDAMALVVVLAGPAGDGAAGASEAAISRLSHVLAPHVGALASIRFAFRHDERFRAEHLFGELAVLTRAHPAQRLLSAGGLVLALSLVDDGRVRCHWQIAREGEGSGAETDGRVPERTLLLPPEGPTALLSSESRLVAIIATADPVDRSHTLYLTDTATIPEGVARFLTRRGISAAEQIVMYAYCMGFSINQIATLRERSIETIRRQIKNGMGRLGLTKQDDLIRVVFGRMAGIDVDTYLRRVTALHGE